MKTARAKSACIALLWAVSLQAQESHLQWEFSQKVQVSMRGLVEVKLPESVVDRSQPGLQDLRIEDDEGHDVPFHLKLPQSEYSTPSVVHAARNFAVSLEEHETVVLVETGTGQALEGLRIETINQNFIKSATVEGSADRNAWRVLIRKHPLFSQDGITGNELRFPKGVWPHLRITIDDSRSAPVLIGSIQLGLAPAEPQNLEVAALVLREKTEGRQESRLRIQLPARNLFLWDLEIESAERVFTRTAALLVRSLRQGEVREETVASGTLYRVSLDGHVPTSNLKLQLGSHIRESELVLAVQNGDNQALNISRVTARWVPPVLCFVAPRSGGYTLRFGNPIVSAPKYDLKTLAGQLHEVKSKTELGPLKRNAAYKQPESLPKLESLAAVIDVAPWQYRASVQVESPGIQELQLALSTLAHADSSGRDLRLVRNRTQIPFLIERTTRTEPIDLSAEAVVSKKRKQVSLWRWTLPYRGLPLAYLSCQAPERVFERKAVLFEEFEDERGSKQKRELAGTTWRHTGQELSQELTLSVHRRASSDTLLLEVENGDNQPLELTTFRMHVPVSVVVFKASPGEETWLYYGNPQASAPRYDIALVAHELLRSPRIRASIGMEELLRAEPWWKGKASSTVSRWFLWTALGAVVVLLLFVIRQLLPTGQDSARGA